jgi:hypothetical protein
MTKSLRVLKAKQIRDVSQGVVRLRKEALDAFDQGLAKQLARRLAGGRLDALL